MARAASQWSGSTGQLLPERITPARLGEVVCVRLQGAAIIAPKVSFRKTRFDFSFYFRKRVVRHTNEKHERRYVDICRCVYVCMYVCM